MYKLLLVTGQADVAQAFTGIQDMTRLFFDPVTVVSTTEEAIGHLRHPGAQAIAFDPDSPEAGSLQEHLATQYPYLPIMRTHRRGDGLRNELSMLREVLDQLHGDFSDDENDVPMILARLEQETLRRLLEERLANANELRSRLLLARSPLKAELPALLFEFDLRDGASFLSRRWSHGFDRLDLSLRANFFGQIPGPLVYSSALLSPLRMRVLACAVTPLAERELDLLSAQTQQLVLGMAAQVKIYMDLELACTQFRVLSRLEDLIPPNH
ncbi:MAG: hypothetical protein GXY84_02015 [Clostridiales bacterium]|nr:hypothetical protein [Clostridiales bacterium]